MQPENFNAAYSAYYDLFYGDKNYEAECRYIDNLLKSLRPDTRDIIELGCGTGNHASFLCQLGYNVTGLERSSEMIEQARGKNINGFSVVQSDIENYTIPQRFDAAISLFHVVSYLVTNNALTSCFKKTSEHLRPGGLFVFDVWYTPAVYSLQPTTRVKRLENDAVKITRVAEPVTRPQENVVQVNYEIIICNKSSSVMQTFQEVHEMRHFSVPEIKLLAAHTGFSLVKTEEFITGNDPDEETWGVVFILRKKE